ncbi:MAG: hypothetical protein JZD41_02515 [Thermoproteus sp.]|nr:hypothetical protein [Thermoproteus sp.]
MFDLKRQFLELLERDVEFRYAVAGYLGILEILKRLDAMEAEIKMLWQEVKALRENQEGPWQKAEKANEGKRGGKTE